jgi:hypothetical protein
MKHNSSIGQLTISYVLFKEIVEAIRKQYDWDTQWVKSVQKIFPGTVIERYKNHQLLNALVKLLQEAMNDATAKSYIEHFMWQLDFGRNPDGGTVLVHGRELRLETIRDLWDVLNYPRPVQ